MVSLKDIARELGVGVSTVSAVLNNKTYCYTSEKKKKIIKETATRMGYIPNQMSRGMQGLPTKTIGIIGSLFSVPVMIRLVDFLNKEIAAAGYSIMLGDSYSEKKKELNIINEFIARGVDGILISSFQTEKELDILLKKRNIPYVGLNKEFNGLRVIIDREAAIEMGVTHLATKHNYKKIAFFTGVKELNIEKFWGYKNGLEKNKISYEERFCIDLSSMESFDKGVEAIIELEVEAVVADNDTNAMKLINTLQYLGKRVPEDIAVIGFDGVEHICSLTVPTLTSIKSPTEKIAKTAMNLLMQQIEGKSVGCKLHLISHELREGGTCGCSDKDSENSCNL